MEQEEDVRAAVAVPLVQRPNARDGVVDQAFVLRHRLLRGVGKIGEQGEPEVRVGVGQVVELEPFQEHRRARRPREHRGDDDEGRVLGRDSILDVELGKHARRQEQGQHLVDHADRQLGERQQQRPRRATTIHHEADKPPSASATDKRGQDGDAQRDRPEIDPFGWPRTQSSKRSRQPGRYPKASFSSFWPRSIR